jgi:hypothetical protein
MRAREFIFEQMAHLPDEASYPMHDTFMLPGVRNNDAYRSYRLSVAMARARVDLAGQDKDLPPWASESALGMYAVVAGFNDTVDPVIDRALAMTNTPGGKKAVSTNPSQEPKSVNTQSPVKPFKGYAK